MGCKKSYDQFYKLNKVLKTLKSKGGGKKQLQVNVSLLSQSIK